MVSIEANAHKVAYMVKLNPEHKVLQIIQSMDMPEIDINTAIWKAEELGLVRLKDERLELVEEPEKWHFGSDVEMLEGRIVYAFTQLAAGETDFEETMLHQWLMGYSPRDIIIAMNHLIQLEIMGRYTIEDDVQNDGSEYTFYTLHQNLDKQWGRKQFKNKPKSKAKNEPKVH